MAQSIINPYAPAAYLGMREVTPEYDFQAFDYVYDVTLTASQILTDQKSIDPDADFVWEAVSIALNSGTFTLRLGDSRLYYLSDARIASAIYIANDPYPLMPPLVIPAGGRITIDIADTSVASNTIQLLFRGAKRYNRR